MAASDWAHWDDERGEYGYYTEDGAWHVYMVVPESLYDDDPNYY